MGCERACSGETIRKGFFITRQVLMQKVSLMEFSLWAFSTFGLPHFCRLVSKEWVTEWPIGFLPPLSVLSFEMTLRWNYLQVFFHFFIKFRVRTCSGRRRRWEKFRESQRGIFVRLVKWFNLRLQDKTLLRFGKVFHVVRNSARHVDIEWL